MKTKLLEGVGHTGCSSCVRRGGQSSNPDIMDYEELACIWWTPKGWVRWLLWGQDLGSWRSSEAIMKWNQKKPGEVSLPEKEEGNEDSMRIKLLSISFVLMHVAVFLCTQGSQVNLRIHQYVCMFCVFMCNEWVWPTFKWACIIKYSVLYLCQFTVFNFRVITNILFNIHTWLHITY